MPPFPLLLLLLVASFLKLPTPASSAKSSRPGCSPTSSCGNLTISYPFWLEEPGRPPCGSPPFQLKCNSSGAFLVRSVRESYRVVSIFTGNNSFHVVDENLPLATGCPAMPFNISLGIWQAPFIISRANAELHFLLCNKSLPLAPPGFRSQSCDRNSFVGLAGEYGLSSHRVQGGIPPGCKFTVVPILERPNGSRDGYVDSMRSGFLLEWAGASDDCPKCVASGGQCTYGEGLRFTCNCTDGIHPEKCGEFGKSKGARKEYEEAQVGFDCFFQTYQVVRIFTDNSSVVVVDRSLPLESGCPVPWFNISIGFVMGPLLISRANKELVFVHNCTTKRQGAPPQGSRRMPCSSHESFVFLGEERRRYSPPECSLSVVPVLGFQDGDYVASMRQGFLLEWMLVPGDCQKCSASGGKCEYSSDGMGFTWRPQPHELRCRR
ncbi:hypothetical protein E2562_000836 [Oryza meyeriana var. granulata]|uniref:Wall-associated receptor kinase galacturonan-binding domain-containing protein n=1 Tax=Oryza meyeriana var. granulata TaxID=110450 RepID=A0A6G1CWQ2_9ORYZ|nr:hypothetical protein E2562_000836 [Oryza meyeriana var. granulata]